jgi:sugar phosphate isomerase/epimerase
MNIIFVKSKWERWAQPLLPFLEDAANAGFSATEVYIPGMAESPEECGRLHRQAGLALVAQIVTEGPTVSDHMRCFEERFLRALNCGPLLVNSHSGRDIWSVDDNLRIFDKALELEDRHGVPICHETHRSRAMFSAPATKALLAARPELKITADFSHWLCVHESDLSDQKETVELAVSAAWHIHARIGHSQGPEVPDPRVPEWRTWLDLSLCFWRGIADFRRDAGADFLTVTPEFGPPPYMPTHPASGLPLADAWELNCWMADFLRRELKAPTS